MTADEVVSVDATAALALSDLDGIMKQEKQWRPFSEEKNVFTLLPSLSERWFKHCSTLQVLMGRWCQFGWIHTKYNAMTKMQDFLFIFIGTPFDTAVRFIQCFQRRLLLQTYPVSKVEPGLTFWSPQSTSCRGCQSCILANWHQQNTAINTIWWAHNESRYVYYSRNPPTPNCTTLTTLVAVLDLVWTQLKFCPSQV